MVQKRFTLDQLAELTGSRLIGDGAHEIVRVSDLETATAEDASFLGNSRYSQVMQRSKAGVIFIDQKTEPPEGKNVLIAKDPSVAFQRVIELFYQEHKPQSGFKGIHPTAIIHPSASIGELVSVGPYTVIDRNAAIGDRTEIGPHCSIGPQTIIGEDCQVYAHVTIRECCRIGDRVIIQPGAVIGSCGFGFATTQEGTHAKLTQAGIVEIEDDVEIGANTTIDRARFETTRIGKGTKIDNLVQIGHGVQIGRDNLIVAQAGIAGSTKTGRHVVLGAKAGIAGHLELEDGVRIAALAGVSKSLPKGDYNGIPAVPIAEYNRNAVYLRNIGKYIEKIKKLIKDT